MAARENGNEPSTHTPSGRLPVLSNDNSKINWLMQSIKMTAFFKRRPGTVTVFKLKMLVGTVAQVTAFRRLHEILNDFVYSVLVEMCGDNQTATALAISDPEMWANSVAGP